MVAEIALSLVLLVAAGLTIRSFIRLQNVPTGFDADNVLTVTVSLPSARYATPDQKAVFWDRALESLRGIPGVRTVGATSRLPLLPGNSTRGLAIPGLPPNTPSVADYRTATPDYFRAIGIPLVRGRTFEDADRESRPFVALVSSSAAKRFWPDRDPMGERFQINTPGPEYTVVGIVGDVHAASLDAAPQPTVYVPHRQDPWPFMTFVLRMASGSAKAESYERSAGLQASVQNAIWRVDKDQPISAIRTMDEQLSRSLTGRRFSVTLFSAFGATAVLLAAVGLYGVLAFVVAQRRREIGVRMALGATAREVIADVMGQGLRLAAIGIAIGIALAIGAARLLQSLLFGTSSTDAATFAGVATLLIVIAAAASALPAFRASRVDPLVALREE